MGFGKWILGSGIVYSILVRFRSSSFTIGKLLGATDVGLYQMAMTLAFLPFYGDILLLSPYHLPAYSLIQDDTPRLQLPTSMCSVLTCFICHPHRSAAFSDGP
jgi:hypothetical protein